MRKIIASEFFTLDGMMSDPKDQMEWVMATFSPELGNYEDSLYEGADTLLQGRVTYKIFEEYWPSAESNPALPEGEAKMARMINSMRKIVFSRTLKQAAWNNSVIMADIVPAEIEKLKQQPGKNMLLIGSANIVQQFTNLGLIDEYHLVVHPVLLGVGKPLFKDIGHKVDLQLIKAEPLANGVVLLQYRPGKK